MEGIIAAAPTPVDLTGVPQKNDFLEHCDWALNNGCDGLNILGSTGEANSFDIATRKKIMKWSAENLPKERLMVGTATPSLSETIFLTRYADDLGYNIALVLPPYYYKPVNETGLVKWFSDLHKNLDTKKISIYFYNFPQMTGITIPVNVIKSLVEIYPKRFKGIKDSSGDLKYCASLVSASTNLMVFPSSETTLQNAVSSGFAGCISATVNITAELCGRLWKDRKNPNTEIIKEISHVRGAITGPNLIPGVKYLIGKRCKNNIWENVLPPFVPLSDTEADFLEKTIQIR